ncbi:MAG TPA: flagellar motor protein MotA [Xanthobacteraceae bacterium]|nr:flagellar motor protein MotA [Xanthobacteraceae bacterium]
MPRDRDFDAPIKISSPRIFLVRMLVFLTLAGLFAVVLYRQIWAAFLNNVWLNSVIIIALGIGILLAIRQVSRLFPEVRWVNGFRVADPGIATPRPPVLLAPMAALLRERTGRMAISQTTMRAILDSIATRLDESRDIARYLTGLLVFLGLLGTFWGLLETVGSIGKVIQTLEIGGDTGAIFENLKSGLSAPLGGMGIAFSSSLFGLAGSLVLGFLDLQAGQAQNRFYTDLEDWLSTTVRDLHVGDGTAAATTGRIADQFTAALERLEDAFKNSGSQQANEATMQLADNLKALVQHMRQEQQIVRGWVEEHGEQQSEIRKLLEKLSRSPAPERRR